MFTDIKFKCKYEGLKAKDQRKTGPTKITLRTAVQVMAAHTCNPRAREADVGGQHGLHREFETGLGYKTRAYLCVWWG